MELSPALLKIDMAELEYISTEDHISLRRIYNPRSIGIPRELYDFCYIAIDHNTVVRIPLNSAESELQKVHDGLIAKGDDETASRLHRHFLEEKESLPVPLKTHLAERDAEVERIFDLQ